MTKPGNNPGIIDTHVTLWQIKKMSVPGVEASSPLYRDYLMKDYIGQVAGTNTKAILIEADVKSAEKNFEFEFMKQAMRMGFPFSGCIVGCYPEKDDFVEFLKSLDGIRGVKGVRRCLNTNATPAGTWLKPGFINNVRMLSKRNLRFELQVRESELAEAVKLVQQCPETKFILNHCGNPTVTKPDLSGWKRDMDALGRLSSVYCKITGMISTFQRDEWEEHMFQRIIDHAFASFGPDRVMFGSDWPFCDIAASWSSWHRTVLQCVSKRSVEQMQKLMHDNAKKCYEL